MQKTKKQLNKILSDHGLWLLRRGGSRADLSWADLSRANLSRANLLGTDLSEANLSRANLLGTDLSGANLSRANLLGTDLSGANLSRANLSGANLSEAKYNLTNVLQIYITGTDELVLELMRWDATVCGLAKMNSWAEGGNCPFSGNISRLFFFSEKRKLWVPDNPKTSLLELWQWVAKENNIKI